MFLNRNKFWKSVRLLVLLKRHFTFLFSSYISCLSPGRVCHLSFQNSDIITLHWLSNSMKNPYESPFLPNAPPISAGSLLFHSDIFAEVQLRNPLHCDRRLSQESDSEISSLRSTISDISNLEDDNTTLPRNTGIQLHNHVPS